jgi:hypothetical protein
VACFPADGETSEELLTAAARNMQKDKHARKNLISWLPCRRPRESTNLLNSGVLITGYLKTRQALCGALLPRDECRV